ncbi:MAG: hypothetical protein V3S64_14745, partial [bacterium]
MSLILRQFTKGLLVTDAVGVLVCFNTAYWVRLQALGPDFLISWNLAWIAALVLTTFYLLGLYDLSTKLGGLEAPVLSLAGMGLVGLLVVAVLFFGGFRELGGLLGRGTIGGGLLLLGGWCAGIRVVALRWRRAHSAGMRWLALCEDEYLVTFWNDYRKKWDRSTLFCLTKRPQPEFSSANPEHPPVVGTWEEITHWIDQPWSGVVMALQSKTVPDSLIEKLMRARLAGTPVMDLTDFYEQFWN